MNLLSTWMRLGALACLLAWSGCAVDPVDFTGKACTADPDCPADYRCDPSGACLPSSVAGPDASGGPRDAAAPGLDAEAEPPDADWVEPPDAGKPDGGKRTDASVPSDAAAPGPDASGPGLDASGPGLDASGPGLDASGPGLDAARPGLDASAPGADAGGGCTDDADCKVLGAYFCGTGGVCQACTTDQKCGATCSPCGLGAYCGGGSSCVPCATDQRCGLACSACPSGSYCGDGACKLCTTDQKCGSSCASCGSGAYCAMGPGSVYSCAGCLTADHCGPACGQCVAPKGACDGAGCVECTSASPCADGLFCLNGTCVECLVNLDCAKTGAWCDGANQCQTCTTSDHCGPACATCGGNTPVCDGAGCVECVSDTDCAGKPGTACCQAKCLANAVPRLAAINPMSVPVLSSGTTLNLRGSGFNSCSQVLADGVPLPTTFLSPSALAATLGPVPVVGAQPIVVRNPGLGGGDSSPNSWSLGGDLALNDNGVGLGYVAAADLVAFAVRNQPSVQLLDPAAFAVISSPIPLPNAVTSLATGDTLVLAGTGNSINPGYALPSFPIGGVTPFFPSNQNAIIDIDEPAGLALLAYDSPNEFELVDTSTLAVVQNVPYGGAPCCNLVSAGFDAAYPGAPFIWFNHGGGFGPLFPGGALRVVVSGGQSSRTTCATNRRSHEVLVFENGAGATLSGYSYANLGSTGSVSVSGEGNVAVNPLVSGDDLALMLLRTNAAILFVDWQKRQVLGTVGPVRNRNCASSGKDQGAPDGIGIDPTRNRAFVLNSCSRMIEGYNLNLLFVK